jgi:two-component sensor histidine kinase
MVNTTKSIYVGVMSIVLALVPLFLFAGFWVSSQITVSIDEMKNDLFRRSDEVTANFDTYFRENIRAVEAISRLEMFDNPEKNLRLLYDSAERLVRDVPTWDALALVRASDAKILFTTAAPFGTELPPSKISVEEFSRLREPKVFSINTPGQIRGQPFIMLAVPIKRQEIQYVFMLLMKRSVMQNLLMSMPDPPGVIVTGILDENYIHVGRSKEPDIRLGKEADRNLQKSITENGRGSGPTTLYDGNQVFVAYVKSKLTNWATVTSSDRGVYNALIRSRDWSVVSGGVLCVLVSLAALGLFLNQRRRVETERLQATLLEQTSATLEERNVLLREIYHRVKNNLQVIQSMLRLSSRNLSEEQREPFEDAITRVGAMAKVHAMLYRSDDLKTVDAGEFVRDIVGEIMAAYGAGARGITSEVKTEANILVSLDNASPLAFVVVELITNSLKHAFGGRTSGRISIDIKVEDEAGLLCVSDDGVGVTEGYRDTRSMGLRMTDRLAEQLNGKMEWPEAGESRFCLTFQLNVGEAEAARLKFATGAQPGITPIAA